MSQVTGIIEVSIDGTLQAAMEGVEFDPGGKVAEAVMANGKYVGFKEKGSFSSLKCKLVDMSDTDLVAIKAFREVTVKVATDTGKSYSAKMSTKSANQNDTEITLEMEGKEATLE